MIIHCIQYTWSIWTAGNALTTTFLQVEVISKQHLQLVGITAMLIASKYEETCIPEVRDLVYITANAYSVKTVRNKEREMLRSLQYSLGYPSPLHFLRRLSKIAKVLQYLVYTTKNSYHLQT